jgi:hypothetical protein
MNKAYCESVRILILSYFLVKQDGCWWSRGLVLVSDIHERGYKFNQNEITMKRFQLPLQVFVLHLANLTQT